MVFAVPQRILLICLLHFCTCAVGQTVNQRTLMNIVRNFENQLGSLGQYAVAFRVERDRCEDSSYSGQELITQQVKQTLQRNEVYVSGTLIAAAQNGKEHSEYRLKNYLKNILNAQDECVGFFTVNSPCLKTCLAESGPYSVKDSLVLLNKYAGIKAFAFKKIWKYDKKEEVIRRLKGIASALPYYQCEKNKATCDPL
ncbi:hypothetical protein ROHU_010637 [Labeo rohita]|uniref:Uncharacterized protein n=1 Tax=Labeo rohita TaxID=84645 RepID=A0A498LUS7_LABRO|nr:hypothetical protein ROHU_010637 [Labeo rohita]